MPWPKAPALHASAGQRRVLDRLRRARTSPHALVSRAEIVCAAADGASTSQIAQRWGLSRNTVQLWRERWDAAGEALVAAEAKDGGAVVERAERAERADHALEAVVRRVLADAPRPGAPSPFTPEQLCEILQVACEPPGDSGRPISHWTPRELAEEAIIRGIVERISARTVGRFLVLGRGRAQAPPDPVLADATRRRPRAARRVGIAGADHL